ncbi:MAG: phosphate ABC transporter substrate-binding protein [gamma proteobacterium symbiont of Bathyaustriella thionipta]|nr:phosphate ABC transporter substrate-binding protein [gamma proteobacterium symbiont of Bathyaustriella thionipta]
MSELALAYEKDTGTKIDLSGGGATKGIRQVSHKQADMGGSCRPRIAEADEEVGARLLPVAWDALVVITHKDNPVDNISLSQLRAIYSSRISNWKELGGPSRPIELYTRKGKISGVGYMTRKLLFNDPEKFFIGSDREFPSSGPLEQAIEKDHYSLGITGVSSARKRDVKMLTLDGKTPSYDNIKSGAYLLYRPLYIATNVTGPHHKEVTKFIDYAHSSKGREIIRKAGSVPYLDAIPLVRRQREERRQAARSNR